MSAFRRTAERPAEAGHYVLHGNDNCSSGEIVERARRPFPGEPIRTLDALHLASALTARTAITDLALLSLDDRIRNAGARLGLPLQPA